MKNSAKKVLSLLMTLVMLVSIFSTVSFSALANDNSNYLFAYFTGNTPLGQQIRFATSQNGETFEIINEGRNVITQTLGTKSCRDPYIAKGKDGAYYAIATDMDATTGWWGNNSGFIVWKSTDLVNWTDETRIDLAQILGVDVYRAWAPQFCFDGSKYMIYLSIAANGLASGEAGATHMFYLDATDILDQSTYSKPMPLFKNTSGNVKDNIDADIVEENGVYYCFYKDETNATICVAKADNLRGPYDNDSLVVFDAGSTIGALEGCQVFKNDNGHWIFMADRFVEQGKFAMYDFGTSLASVLNSKFSQTFDISSYNIDSKTNINICNPRHGCVLKISDEEYNNLMNTNWNTTFDVTYKFDVDYYVENWHYDTLYDTYGNNFVVMTQNDGNAYSSKDGKYISLYKSNVFIGNNDINTLLSSNSWTTSLDFTTSIKQNAVVLSLTSGNASPDNTDWIRILDNGEIYYNTGYSQGANNNNYEKIGTMRIDEAVEYHLDITYDGDCLRIYSNGNQVCNVPTQKIGFNKTSPITYVGLGMSDTVNNTYMGTFSNVRFRSTVLNADDVKEEYENADTLVYKYNNGVDNFAGRNYVTNSSSGVVDNGFNKEHHGSSYTIAGWINAGSSVGGDQTILEFGNGGTDGNKQYFSIDENGRWWYCWGDNGTMHYFDGTKAFGNSSLNANTWYYTQVNIVAYKNTVRFSFYLNGNKVSDAWGDNASYFTGRENSTGYKFGVLEFFNKTSMPVRFGAGNAHWSGDGSSYVDDIRVYSRAMEADVLYSLAQNNIVPISISSARDVEANGFDGVLNENQNITITNSEEKNITYTVTYDNGDEETYTTKDKKVSFAPFENNTSSTVTVRVTINEDAYKDIEKIYVAKKQGDTLVYQESFEDAKVNDFVVSSSKGYGSLASRSAGSIVSLAGPSDRGPNSSSMRQNVLKLNKNETAPGNYFQLNENPLNDDITRAVAKADGVTISFWRYIEQNGAVTDLAQLEWDKTGYDWQNAIAFQRTAYNTDYYLIEANGVQSRCAVDGTDYADFVPEMNDKTLHGSNNNSGAWTNITVTIDPNNTATGGTVYVNGVPREYNSSKLTFAGKYSADKMNVGDIAKDILDFITKSTTNFYINNGVKHEGNDYDMYFDDIRIYTGVKTQLEIYNMFTDELSDGKENTSITHDPTNVTAYTLAAGTYVAKDGSGDSIKVKAGKTVGEEFINYYDVDLAKDVTNIEYYSFGTGMVVEKSTDGVNWEKVGDSKGGFAYQNEELFSFPYTTALKEALDYAKGDGSGEGAGYLVWAPHVMYNLSLNKWVYYGSTSSWGSQRSAIFYCTSDTVYEHYTYKAMVYVSEAGTYGNAIDPDVYYGYDTNGIIDKNQLYLAYGSWGWMYGCEGNTIWGRRINASTGGKFDNDNLLYTENVDYKLALGNAGSGEGAYVIYRNGYYYLYQTYGTNDGTYTETYFRCTSPTGPFERADGEPAISTENGMMFMSSYHINDGKYVYWSNGHNSVYTVYNQNNEPMTINVAHSRALSNQCSTTVDTGMLITSQTTDWGGYMAGNIAISNLVGFTKNGWQVMFPFEYNGEDTTAIKLTANDIVGEYYYNDLVKEVNNSYSISQHLKIIACTDTSICFDVNGEKSYFDLEYGKDSYGNDNTYIVGKNSDLEGVFAMHGDIVEFSMFNTETLQHTFGYMYQNGKIGHDVVGTYDAENDVIIYQCNNGCNEVKDAYLDTYRSAVKMAEDSLRNTTAYTEESRKALQKVLDENRISTEIPITTYYDVDEIITKILSTKLEYVKFKYNLNIVDYSTGNVIETVDFVKDYSTNLKLDLSCGTLDYSNYGIKKWTHYKDGIDTLLPLKSNLDCVVNSDEIYCLYVEENATTDVDENFVDIKMLNKSNKVFDCALLEKKTGNITVDDEKITINGITLTAENVPFYKVVGFMINEEVVSTGDVINVQDEIIIKPIYSVK